MVLAAGREPRGRPVPSRDKLRFLAPFDPVVWDRRRFQLFWGWEYKLEAYVPAHKRRMGHYAMPMLWGEQMLGWANLKVIDGRLQHELGFAGPRPRGSAFQLALERRCSRCRNFWDSSTPRARIFSRAASLHNTAVSSIMRPSAKRKRSSSEASIKPVSPSSSKSARILPVAGACITP